MTLYFFGVTPSDPLRERIDAFRAKWNHPHHKVEPHITLKAPFGWPGNPAPVLKAVQAVCAASAPFTLTLGAPGRFGGARVLFLSVAGEPLWTLQKAVVAAVMRFAPPERRGGPNEASDPYHPHLTLAATRFGIDAAGIAAMEREAGTALAGLPPFTVTAMRCYRKERDMERWQVCTDLPLGSTQSH